MIEELVQVVDDCLRLHRHIGTCATLLEQLLPFPHALLCLCEEAVVLFTLNEREQLA